ncbi:Hermansky-Pudlak syndrome 5 protein homolog [Contarinia nasturtii]|uniref:Hermansky-Pudlak syndrome 5 protein homolog n=1 Tax=Contarinia nasturtii TaxID=265458 RepID=UPI0012D41FC0|nr:Hermansky-Pudlak syndrome 5 protein homolog [Contarinia nasturtii]
MLITFLVFKIVTTVTPNMCAIHIYVRDYTAVKPIVISSYYHQTNITQIKWSRNENQLFFGDVKGTVFLVNLNNFLGRNTNISIHPILFLESPIVQISQYEQLLLVSNYSKCILCNTETEEFKQIGTQPRDGKFGACFFVNSNKLITTRVICARPRSRLWECSIDGNVLKTHNFKYVLETGQIPNLEAFSTEPIAIDKKQTTSINEINEQLNNLQVINKMFVLGYTANAFYIFDILRSKILLWCNKFGNIHTLKVMNEDTIFLFTQNHKAYTFQIKKLNDLFFEASKEHYEMDPQNMNYFKNKLDSPLFREYYSILREKSHRETNCENVLGIFKTLDKMISQNVVTTHVQNMRSKKLKTENELDQTHSENLLLGYECKITENITDNKEDFYNSNTSKMNLLSKHQFEKSNLIIKNSILQNMYCIYKSLKVSKFDLNDRYAEFFDNYDLHKIKKVLNALELIILENEKDVTQFEAKKSCACIYLNYVKIDILKDLSEESENFIIECFLVVNSKYNGQFQRCHCCKFPLSIMPNVVKYKEIIEVIITRLVKQGERQTIFGIVEAIPSTIYIYLKVILNENFASLEFNFFVDIFFSCAHKSFFNKHIQRFKVFSKFDFWVEYLTRLMRLHKEEEIHCIRCGTYSKLELKGNIKSENIYSYDYFFETMTIINNKSALELCKISAHDIPSDAISKIFYMKCLLGSH